MRFPRHQLQAATLLGLRATIAHLPRYFNKHGLTERWNNKAGIGLVGIAQAQTHIAARFALLPNCLQGIGVSVAGDAAQENGFAAVGNPGVDLNTLDLWRPICDRQQMDTQVGAGTTAAVVGCRQPQYQVSCLAGVGCNKTCLQGVGPIYHKVAIFTQALPTHTDNVAIGINRRCIKAHPLTATRVETIAHIDNG